MVAVLSGSEKFFTDLNDMMTVCTHAGKQAKNAVGNFITEHPSLKTYSVKAANAALPVFAFFLSTKLFLLGGAAGLVFNKEVEDAGNKINRRLGNKTPVVGALGLYFIPGAASFALGAVVGQKVRALFAS